MKEERVKFQKGAQKKFFSEVKNKSNYSISKLSGENKIPKQTLANYISGRCLMPSFLFENFCKKYQIDAGSFDISYLPENWGHGEAGRKGMAALMKKYPDKMKLWRSKGAKKGIAGKNIKKINCPELNEELAEFIGAYLGDGTINEYLIKISGDSRYDLRYFEYLSNLVQKLFNLNDSKIVKSRTSNELTLIIRSKNLCSFLRDNYGIKFGDKIRNQTRIPNEILSDKKFTLACLRGLVDTDGCISRRGRNGSQFCVQFFNGNNKLLEQVRTIGFKYGFFSYFTGQETGTNSWEKVKKYFNEVGSSNMKHIVRFNVKLQENKTLYLREVLDYYTRQDYFNLNLPFRLNYGPTKN